MEPNHFKDVHLMVITGPAGVGKTTLAKKLQNEIGPSARIISLDDHLFGPNRERREYWAFYYRVLEDMNEKPETTQYLIVEGSYWNPRHTHKKQFIDALLNSESYCFASRALYALIFSKPQTQVHRLIQRYNAAFDAFIKGRETKETQGSVADLMVKSIQGYDEIKKHMEDLIETHSDMRHVKTETIVVS